MISDVLSGTSSVQRPRSLWSVPNSVSLLDLDSAWFYGWNLLCASRYSSANLSPNSFQYLRQISDLDFFRIHDQIIDLDVFFKIFVRSEISKTPLKLCWVTESGEWLNLRAKSEVWEFRQGSLWNNRLPWYVQKLGKIVDLEFFRIHYQINDLAGSFKKLVRSEISRRSM